MGQHMTGWGVPRSTGRIYGYLLTSSEPVSLDRIAAELGIAKSGVSVATRQLVGFGLARSLGERGSRRLLYEALVSVEAILAARNAQTGDLLDRLHQGARAAPPGPARARLEEMADLMQELTEEIPRLLERIRQRRRT
jgi:DNA-binding transcriptional regulator GbsR (MarR family)